MSEPCKMMTLDRKGVGLNPTRVNSKFPYYLLYPSKYGKGRVNLIGLECHNNNQMILKLHVLVQLDRLILLELKLTPYLFKLYWFLLEMINILIKN